MFKKNWAWSTKFKESPKNLSQNEKGIEQLQGISTAGDSNFSCMSVHTAASGNADLLSLFNRNRS